MPTTPAPTPRIAILSVAAFVVINVAFYFLSDSYFASRTQMVGGVSQLSYSPEQMMHVRITFAVFSGVIAAFALGAGVWPRVIGHLIPALLGVLHLVGCVFAFSRSAPGVVGVTLLVSGVAMPLLAWHSFRGSRAAWAPLITICGVFALVGLFGAPKVRDALSIGLWTAMILPGLDAVAAITLFTLRDEYLDGGRSST
ncbi:MAG TPA: hypothetical protein VFK02_10395 [Kofleriaceae bacterium]|nr:hypothetical protein [Kofleriaceae bacterium]